MTKTQQFVIDNQAEIIAAGQLLQKVCFGLAADAGWHTDIKTGLPLQHDAGNRCMLIVSEVSEAFEGFRKNLNDDHLPTRKMAEVEFADTVIRVADTCGYYGFDLGTAIVEKAIYNMNRADHKIEARLEENGKKF